MSCYMKKGKIGWNNFRICSQHLATECARDRDLHWGLPMRILNRKIFGLHSKVMLPQHIYACNFVAITLVGPTKVSIMKLKCIVLNRMLQHDFMMKQIFFSSIFLPENTVRLAKQAGYPGHNPWHTRYVTPSSLYLRCHPGRCLFPIWQRKCCRWKELHRDTWIGKEHLRFRLQLQPSAPETDFLQMRRFPNHWNH